MMMTSQFFYIIPDYSAVMVRDTQYDYSAVMPHYSIVTSNKKITESYTDKKYQMPIHKISKAQNDNYRHDHVDFIQHAVNYNNVPQQHHIVTPKRKSKTAALFSFMAFFTMAFFSVMMLTDIAYSKSKILDNALIPYNEINNNHITLGDVMLDLPDDLAKIVIGPAPALGKSYDIPTRFIKKVMRKLKYRWQDTSLMQNIVVKRKAQTVKKDDLNNILYDHIIEHGFLDDWNIQRYSNTQINIKVERPYQSIFIPYHVSIFDIPIKDIHYHGKKSRLKATLALSHIDSSLKDVPIDARIMIQEDVVVAAKNIRYGQIIRAEDITTALRPINHHSSNQKQSFYYPDDIIGQEAKRTIRPDAIIHDDMIQEPLLVKAKDTIIMRYKINFLELTAKAIALEEGRLGDKIRVKNNQSGREIEGYIINKGMVSTVPVTMSPVTVPSQKMLSASRQQYKDQHMLRNKYDNNNISKKLQHKMKNNPFFNEEPIPFAKFNHDAGRS